jgi:hypothetical protein
MFFVTDFLQFGQDSRATFVEILQASMQAGLGRGGGSTKFRHCRGHPAGVIEIQFDDFAVRVKRPVANRRRDGAVGFLGNSRQLRNFEIGGPELLPRTYDLVRLRTADP